MMYRLLLTVSLIAACAARAEAQERQWTLDASDEDAYLVFGTPETDDVGLSMWCPVQQGGVNIFVPEAHATQAAGQSVPVILKAGEETTEVTGQTEVNLEAGMTSLEVRLPADHPIFRAMQDTDRFKITVGGEESIFPLIDADLAGLLALCRKP